MASRSDNIEVSTLETKTVSSYDMINKLTAKFDVFIESSGIPVPALLIANLRGDNAGEKIAFIKTHLCSRVHGLEALIRDHLKSNGAEVPQEKINRCVRFLRAMAEVADQ